MTNEQLERGYQLTKLIANNKQTVKRLQSIYNLCDKVLDEGQTSEFYLNHYLEKEGHVRENLLTTAPLYFSDIRFIVEHEIVNTVKSLKKLEEELIEL